MLPKESDKSLKVFSTNVSPKKSNKSLNDFSIKSPVDISRLENSDKYDSTFDEQLGIRSTLQPSLEIKLNTKRDPAVIRNKQENSREVLNRKISFNIP
jgi:hypothetical protein